MKTAQYLDAAKRRLELSSDYALAKHLGVSTSRLGNWRAGRSLPDTAMAVQLAELLELDERKVIADIELERGGTDGELWRRLARKVAGVLVTACAMFPAPDAYAAAGGFNISVSAVPAWPSPFPSRNRSPMGRTVYTLPASAM